MPAHLARVGEPVEPRDLTLALEPGWVIGRKVADEGLDALAELEGTMRG
jgi:hypothetical protein